MVIVKGNEVVENFLRSYGSEETKKSYFFQLRHFFEFIGKTLAPINKHIIPKTSPFLNNPSFIFFLPSTKNNMSICI